MDKRQRDEWVIRGPIGRVKGAMKAEPFALARSGIYNTAAICIYVLLLPRARDLSTTRARAFDICDPPDVAPRFARNRLCMCIRARAECFLFSFFCPAVLYFAWRCEFRRV